MNLITLYLLSCISLNNAEAANPYHTEVKNSIEIVQQEPDEEKATAIFWIDKRKRKKGEALKVRTVKAKVIIFNEGNIKLLSFTKVQPPNVEKYILERLKVFKVTKKMLDSGYIKPGQQYVQLRYIPENVK